MIVINEKVIELNAYEQAAAARILFPFGKFKTRIVGREHTHMRVEFPDAQTCNDWRERIFDALPTALETQR